MFPQKEIIKNAFTDFISNVHDVQKVKTLKKLNNMYQHSKHSENGKLFLKCDNDHFINLSQYTLTEVEKQFLNLGLNFHVLNKYSTITKEVELEILYSKLLDLENKNKINIEPRLNQLLAAESHKHRNPRTNNNVITPQLREAAKTLRNNPEITIRKADKSSTYVIIDKKEYVNKINDILKDTTKFQKITRNPIDSLKIEANKLINNHRGLYPGYIYGNIKTQ